jgi:hypothetical protein
MFQNAILMPSWKGPELLKVSIPAVLRSLRADSKLFVLLNSADEESITICRDNKVQFMAIEANLGTPGVDLFRPLLDCQFVSQINSDMIPSVGWDQKLIEVVNSESCSASTQLVEPHGTGNPLVIVENLGEFGEELEKRFQERYLAGDYNRDSVIGYNHPIMVRTSDYFKVGGYSNYLDPRWMPLAYGLDDHFAWRLWKMYKDRNEPYRHISVGNAFTYHCISATNNKIDKSYRDANNGMNHFQADSGMDIWNFRQQINAFSKV